MINNFHLISHRGDKQVNEDYAAFLQVKPDYTVAILADGLGGFTGGEVASKLVVESIEKRVLEGIDFTEEYVEEIVTSAHYELLQDKAKGQNHKMASTVVILIYNCGKVVYGYVGDSRLYRLREGVVDFVTRDHSVCSALVKMGELDFERIRFSPEKNKITRAVGQDEGFAVTVGTLDIDREKDALILCSDGVWENLYTAQLELEYCKSADMKAWAKNIEERILTDGKENMDNYSMIVMNFYDNNNF